MSTPALLPYLILFVFGGVAFLAYVSVGKGRYSLLFLGITFWSIAISVFFRAPYFAFPLLLAIIALVMAIRESIAEMKARLDKMREEERAREEAFAEVQAALARKAEIDEKTPESQ